MFGFHRFVSFKESLTGCLSCFASQFLLPYLKFWMPQNFTKCSRYPLIDANMKELSTTGFMSNRGRQANLKNSLRLLV
jgi:hypothetical protein